MKIVAVIPCPPRFDPMPRKPLREILGKPMIQRVYEAAHASGLENVLVATDSTEIQELGKRLGMRVEMTSAGMPERNGPGAGGRAEDRCRCLHERAGRRTSSEAGAHSGAGGAHAAWRRVKVGTLKTPCPAPDVQNPNSVKVVTDHDGRALYFSRATIPHDRDLPAT